VAEGEGEVVVAAGVGQPVPAGQARAADDQAVAERLHGFEEGGRCGRQVAGEALLAVAVEDDEEQGPGVAIDAGVESGAGGGLIVAHEGLQVRGCDGRRLGASSLIAGESLHEYPGVAADRGRPWRLWWVMMPEAGGPGG
jgi:hypothetical protein